MKNVQWVRRVTAFLSVTLTLGAQGQEPGAPQAASGSEAHYWAVLLDASQSFNQRDGEMSQLLGSEYRLRHEVMALTETLLAAKRIKEYARKDFIFTYVFGETVAAIDAPAAPEVRWPPIRREDDYSALIQAAIRRARIGERTDYFAALDRAVKDFASIQASPDKKPHFHLILISDGELDVGVHNRLPRGRMEPEELEKYEYFLQPGVNPVKWLQDHNVDVHTLAIDDGFSELGIDDGPRQKQIRRKLSGLALHGPTPLERAASFVRRLAESGSSKFPEGEGPYVMQALADACSGVAHSVRYDNMPQVLWSTLFPEATRKRTTIPSGTSGAIIFAPKDLRVPVRLKGGRDFALFYDRPQEGLPEGVDVEVEGSTQYATWVVTSDELLEVGGLPLTTGFAEKVSVFAIQNVSWLWEAGRPPKVAALGEPLALGLELRWKDRPPGPSVAEWRSKLADMDLQVEVTLEGPDGTEIPTGNPEIQLVDDASSALLRVRVPVQGVEKLGIYHPRVKLFLGDPETVSPILSEPLAFTLVPESPLQSFRLFLRDRSGSEPGNAIEVKRPREGEVEPITLTARPPVRVSFEWRGKQAENCAGLEALKLELPDFGHQFGDGDNELAAGPHEALGGELLCYRTAPKPVTAAQINTLLSLKVTDGRISWGRSWIVQEQKNWWPLIILSLLLLAALALGWALRERLADGLRARWLGWRGQRADFPLAVWGSFGRLAWHPGAGPRRFLLVVGPDNQLGCELTNRGPDRNKPCAEIRPQALGQYRIRALSDSDWQLREVAPKGQPGLWYPLGREGLEISLLDLSERKRFEIRHGEESLTVGARDL